MRIEKRLYYALVFFRFQRAGGIDQGATRLKMSKGVVQESELEGLELLKLFGSEPPADLGTSLQSPRAGARSIHENLVKQLPKWKRARAVAGNPAQVFPIVRMQAAANLPPLPAKVEGVYGIGAAFQAGNL